MTTMFSSPETPASSAPAAALEAAPELAPEPAANAPKAVESQLSKRTQVTDGLESLIDIFPDVLRLALASHPARETIVEVVMDLGRPPEIRHANGSEYLGETFITREDLQYCGDRVGDFGADNRAGIERTLHRISAMRNRRGEIIGLTCRIGRAVFGTIGMIRDLVETGGSILMLGRPGVGKTTALREIARVLADDLGKRVVIIDTSNEIAGDGDIPHPAIGRARRMQVARPELQHQVMIEAVENHMPEVIVIDEIGTELEALAARTIAERGVQLVGTAHGNQLENLIKNPTLSDLIGGIQAVTLGDDEARRRGSQKTVLERKAPPTFDIAIEMLERQRWVVHENVADTIDLLLRGREPQRQIRATDEQTGNITVEYEAPTPSLLGGKSGHSGGRSGYGSVVPLEQPPTGLRASGRMAPLAPVAPMKHPKDRDRDKEF
ncbi:MAG: AAA family ATPase, partial [Cyanobacteria bacterium J06641_5]